MAKNCHGFLCSYHLKSTDERGIKLISTSKKMLINLDRVPDIPQSF